MNGLEKKDIGHRFEDRLEEVDAAYNVISRLYSIEELIKPSGESIEIVEPIICSVSGYTESGLFILRCYTDKNIHELFFNKEDDKIVSGSKYSGYSSYFLLER